MAPRLFKTKLADFAPQFSGYNQHDSQVSDVLFVYEYHSISFLSRERSYLINMLKCL